MGFLVDLKAQCVISATKSQFDDVMKQRGKVVGVFIAPLQMKIGQMCLILCVNRKWFISGMLSGAGKNSRAFLSV